MTETTVTSDKKVLVKLKAGELTDVDVSFVSLVNAPANQIPFRVTKTDKGEQAMINITTVLKAQETPIGVAGVAVRKGYAGTDEILKSLGFTGDPKETGDVEVYTSSEFSTDGATTLKMSDDVAILVSGVQKYFDPWKEDETFADAMGSGGYFSSLHTAMDAFMDVVYKSMDSAQKPQDAQTKIDKLVADFSKYVTTLTNNIPEAAFVVEKTVKKYADISEVSVGEKAEAEEDNSGDPEAEATTADADASDKDAGSEAKEDGDAATGAKDAEGEEADTGAESAESADSEGAEGDAKESTDGAEEAKDKTSKADKTPAWAEELATKVSSLAEKVEGLDAKVSKSSEALQKEVNTLKDGTVLTGDDPESVADVLAKSSTSNTDDIWAGTALDNLG
jgi:hypothetical protein